MSDNAPQGTGFTTVSFGSIDGLSTRSASSPRPLCAEAFPMKASDYMAKWTECPLSKK
jgi:hypothetical protein